MSTIKINRALARAAIGAHPGSAADMLAAIPTSVQAALTAAQLAELLDATWHACQHAKSLAMTDAVDEGAVWDARDQRLRLIAA